MKPATEILLSAAFVLTPEENWTKGVYVRCDIRTGAPSWCLIGALSRAAASVPGVYETALLALQTAAGTPYLAIWNDHPKRTHAEVLRALYQAAEIAEAS